MFAAVRIKVTRSQLFLSIFYLSTCIVIRATSIEKDMFDLALK